MDLCLETERRLGPRISKRWWEQDGVDVEGMLMVYREAEQIKGEKEMDRKDK